MPACWVAGALAADAQQLPFPSSCVLKLLLRSEFLYKLKLFSLTLAQVLAAVPAGRMAGALAAGGAGIGTDVALLERLEWLRCG